MEPLENAVSKQKADVSTASLELTAAWVKF